jgi:hypothetical protein
MVGAAWANAMAYGTLAAVTGAFSWRVYPIPYEWGRLLRIAAAAGVAYWVGSRLVPASVAPLTAVPLRGALTAAAYASLLFVTGFFHAGELRFLEDIRRRAFPRQAAPTADTHQVEMAGEIVATAPEPDSDLDGEATGRFNQDSRASRH